MAREHTPIHPRTFFLNETHELAPAERRGGGRLPNYVGIAWAAKAQRLNKSIGQVMKAVAASNDPLKDDRFFVVAQPVTEVEKRSKDKKKATSGTVKEPTRFGEAHGKVFERLGLDLLQVTDDGRAVVHGDRDKVEQLHRRSGNLGSLGVREQARWVTIDSFEVAPLQLRVDADWLKGLKQHEPSEIVIELQPVIRRQDADRVVRAIADLLAGRSGERLVGSGTDFSGRHWFRGKATQGSVRTIARDYYSVQAIHGPLFSIAAAKSGSLSRPKPMQAARQVAPIDAISLPCVAMLDLGVPSDHKHLANYRRSQFVPQDVARPPVGSHGSFVASRIVFGQCDSDEALAETEGTCSFYDVMVGDYPGATAHANRVNDKVVMDAIRGASQAAPDVRVFNLSFGDARPLAAFSGVEHREKRVLLQDLDNFVFATDSIVVVAAGNSPPGAIPNAAYPEHHVDPQWALGPWACGFNTLVCGSFVGKVSAGGLVQSVGWPSPFSRIGPGLCEAPIPSFGAEGGNTDENYNYQPGLGVWGYSDSGLPEDRVGTSHAAPLLAREAAIAFAEVQRYCVSDTRPFAVTVRAFLALTASRTTHDAAVMKLTDRTLGFGKASARRIISPATGSAVVLWQGFIESPKDTVRVQLPIPLEWLAKAGEPILRLVICYDPPVNEAARGTWACRKVKAVLHLGPDAPFVLPPRGAHESYPLIHRDYHLARYKPGQDRAAVGDLWLLELSYNEIFGYPPPTEFHPRQRIAFAAELIDEAEAPIDPQQAMQNLPIAASMTRLSIQPAAIRMPVMIRTR
jgi:hypothetical protein